MQLADILSGDAIFLDYPAGDKHDFLSRAAAIIADLRPAIDRSELLELLKQREQTMTTGIGSGVAIPHVFCTGIDDRLLCLFRLARPIAFDALDNQDVDLIFLCLTSRQTPVTPHIQLLAHIALLLKQATFLPQIRSAATPAEILEVIRRHERS